MGVEHDIAGTLKNAAARDALLRALVSAAAEDWAALYASCTAESADDLLAAAVKARDLRHAAHEKLVAAALAVSPSHVDANVAMAQSYLARGLDRQAHALLANVRRQRAGKQPDHAGLDEWLLRASRAAGATEDARAAAYRLATNPDAAWEALIDAAEFFRADNDLDAQRTLFARVIALRPQDPQANLFMAAWLHDEGYDKNALEHLGRAKAAATTSEQRLSAARLDFELRFPEQSAEFRALTTNFFDKDMGEALPVLKRLTRRHPDFADAWLYLGYALRRVGRLEPAIAALLRCARLADIPEAHRELGALFGEARDAARAVKHAKRALALAGESDLISWLNLGAALCDLGRRAQAAEALARARALSPRDSRVQRLEQSINERRKPLRGYYNARMVQP